jgi:hypothetical protein
MLRIDALPLRGPDLAFVSRAEWLRLTHELLLVRLAAIRDLGALLVSAVFELTIPPPQITVGRLLRDPQVKMNSSLGATLKRLGAAAPDLREERNKLVHAGVRRAFGEYQLFDNASYMEAIGSAPIVEPFRRADGTLHHFDLATEQKTIAGELDRELQVTADELCEIVSGLLELLHPEWLQRFRIKEAQRRGGGTSPMKSSKT